MTSQSILVIGASGKSGRRIADRLAVLGHTVRKGSRSSSPAFDCKDSSRWPDALHGIDSVYISYYPDLAVPEAPRQIEELVNCAAAAGVERLVLLSGRGEANAERCEELVRNSGIDFTLLRASWFAQNFDEGHFLDSVLAGTLALPAGDVREPFIDVDDIADVAVAALTEEGHAGQLYELTGPRLMSFDDVVGEISRAAGREISYVPITLEQFREGMTEHAGAELANMLSDLCQEVLDGRNEWLGDGVHAALGRQARDFADYARQTAATGVWRVA